MFQLYTDARYAGGIVVATVKNWWIHKRSISQSVFEFGRRVTEVQGKDFEKGS